MIRLQLLTSWVLDDDTNRPQVWLDLGAAGVLSDGDSITDQPTSQPAQNITPDPNAVIVEMVLHDAAYDWLIASNDYGIGAILWSETV